MRDLRSTSCCKLTIPRSGKAFLLLGLMQSILTPSYSQYTYDPSAADEQGQGIRYFGSAKDEKGVLISGVTVAIEIGGTSTFVFVTDDQGRFRGRIPLVLAGPASNAATKCSKPGYRFVRSIQRPGVDAPKPYVQVDCVLHVLP